ncbi:ParB/RepB/Spo0J family partition protein [Legionella jordanis]|uniref:Probable chromosome-partitioning protein ParB n=1 Tax=Legionella jordanis TaxID=456 RepID=A0A0W0VDM2_9GAMM|nr:ParB/RepB/Spo0J family partition protein [Legionella jordanis]KTD18227.1 chromosome partitioning protein ParB [Legionella jordanis]RMX01185.1 ParB/RepB/Spo0J family partition protein [Legionella jordanis]RMX21415.1 ParB/RepB/Spo0J family partition protein [Legionella jordanis]VEH13680.1 chromosome partitioning protein ParB [Legionella jordanis]HAT8714609.1 ParB/RepB/Spo0J family partition protein [Legionella jordanis]
MQTEFKLIPIEYLQRGRYQPRRSFDAASLQELADSIVSQGLIEPLVVRKNGKDSYEIIAGERRWRAAMLAQIAQLPCLISDYSDEQAAAVSLIENIQRQNLNLIEEAQGYHRLITEFHFHQDEIATLLGKSRSHVANILRLLSLCETVQDLIKSGTLSMGHAKMLVGLLPAQQQALARQIEEQQWSVRQLEQKVREIKQGKVLQNPRKDRDIERLETKIAEQIGAPVQIIANDAEGGVLQIKFFNNDTLAGLLERLGLSYD